MERFQPIIGEAEEGEGGTIKFLKSDCEAHSDGSKPILVAGEDAGLDAARSAAARASATPASASSSRARSATCAPGRSPARAGEMVRTCINAPEGPVEIEL